MAYLYQRVRGMELQEAIAHQVDVQIALDERAFEIAVRAERALIEHRVDGIAHIEVEKHDVDSYVVLVDSNVTNDETAKSNSALSIEAGRAGYIDEHGVTYGSMKALNILANAAHLPEHAKRIPKKRRPRYGRKRSR